MCPISGSAEPGISPGLGFRGSGIGPVGACGIRGVAPGPGERIYWKVKASAGDRHSGWSEPAFWETGLMDASAWKAQWIEADLLEDPDRANPAPFLRKEFRTQKMVIKAILYVTARGLYRVHLNGVRAGDQEFTPGWTSYHKRLQYQVYDVTGMVKNGDNAIGVILGDGWYRGNIGWQGERNLYGDKTALLLQLKITFYDGSALLVFSDGSWKSSTSPILSSEIYHGEVYDARLEKRGWDLPGYDDSDWAGVLTREYGYDSLTATVGPPVRVTREIKPAAFITTPWGSGCSISGRTWQAGSNFSFSVFRAAKSPSFMRKFWTRMVIFTRKICVLPVRKWNTFSKEGKRKPTNLISHGWVSGT